MTEHKNVWAAFAAAQSEFKSPEQSGLNPHFKAKYSTLGDIFKATFPALHKHGLAFVQSLESYDGRTILHTTIKLPSDEQSIMASVEVPTGQNPQQFGSALSYMKRYSAAAMLGVVDGMEDDGEIASTPQPRKSNPPSRNGKRAVEPPPEEAEYMEPEQPAPSASVKLSKEDTQRIQDWLKDTGTARKAAEDWAVEIGACKNTFEAHNSMTKIVNVYGGKANAKNVGSIMEQYVYHQIEKLAAPVEEEVA